MKAIACFAKEVVTNAPPALLGSSNLIHQATRATESVHPAKLASIPLTTMRKNAPNNQRAVMAIPLIPLVRPKPKNGTAKNVR
jgi:hypothetical protein